MDLQPLKTFRASSNAASLLRHEGRTFLVKRYVGENASARRACEAQALKAWQDAGCKVPQVLPLELPDLADTPYLVMTYLEGPTLQEYLRTRRACSVTSSRCSPGFSRAMPATSASARTTPATALHPDPNSSNVILAAGGFYFIDFETQVPGPEEAAAIGTAEFCRWTARDLGRPGCRKWPRLVEAYREHLELLHDHCSGRADGRSSSSTAGRMPVNGASRGSDENDVADALNEALAEASRRPAG